MASVTPRRVRGRAICAARPALAVVVLACLAPLVGCGGDAVTVGTSGSPAPSASGSGSPADSGTSGSAGGSEGSAGTPGAPTDAASAPAGSTSTRTSGGGSGATGTGAPVPWDTGAPGSRPIPADLPSAASGPARLSILLDDGSGVRTTWTLTCDPAGGTHPTPGDACGVLGARGARAFPAPPADAICTEQYGGPQQARITGTWRGRSVSAELSLENGCQITRWTALLGLLPPGGVS